jgi:hypothetical protein
MRILDNPMMHWYTLKIKREIKKLNDHHILKIKPSGVVVDTDTGVGDVLIQSFSSSSLLSKQSG